MTAPPAPDALLSCGGPRTPFTWRGFLAACAGAVVLLLPFLNKAFHIDDTVYLWVAEQVRREPLNYYGFLANWYSYAQPVYEFNQNPPGVSYFIALASLVVGWSEPALHAVFLLPAAAVAGGTYALATRLTRAPLAAAWAAVVTPAFLVSATNVMSDVLMLAFYIWAVVAWVKAAELYDAQPKRAAALLAASGLCIAAGTLTKYFALSTVPLLCAYMLFRRRKPGWWLLAFLIPAAAVALFEWWNVRMYGRLLLLNAGAYATDIRGDDETTTLGRALAGLAFAGGCTGVALFYAPVLWRWRGWAAAGALAGVTVVTAYLMGTVLAFEFRNEDGVVWTSLLQLALWAAVGGFVVILPAHDLWHRRTAESALLALWLWGTAFFSAYVNWSTNARTMLPLVPAAAILLTRAVENRWPDRFRARLYTPLLPAALLALAVAYADYTWAGSARNLARTLETSKAQNPGTRIHYQGHWGLQHYMDRIGAVAFDEDNFALHAGDVMVVPENNTNSYVFAEGEDITTPVGVLDAKTCQWLSVMRTTTGAGFYSSMFGPLPFVFGWFPHETYTVYQFTRSIRPPETGPAVIRPDDD